jgi:hypothetical protein
MLTLRINDTTLLKKAHSYLLMNGPQASLAVICLSPVHPGTGERVQGLSVAPYFHITPIKANIGSAVCRVLVTR